MSPQNNRRSGYFSGEMIQNVTFRGAFFERWAFSYIRVVHTS